MTSTPERRAYMRDYMRRYRHTYGGGRGGAPTYPIHTPRVEVGLGAVIARSFRESA